MEGNSLDNPYEERDFSKLSYADLKKLKKKRREILADNTEKLQDVVMNKWMKKTDRDQYLDFDENVLFSYAVQKKNQELLRFFGRRR